ncbi:MAG: Gfo/Idh/MocA family oxidoreductase [Oligoflexales bacterium]|nr:Gfo/Idh/MocA family oxidoreductase [Oligoflexales bacterium]
MAIKYLLLAILFINIPRAEATATRSLFSAAQLAAKTGLRVQRGLHTQVPLGIIGAGRIGQMHIANIKNHIPEAKINWLADPYLADYLEYDPDILTTASSYEDLLRNSDVSNVAIFASTDQHVNVIRQCIRAGKKYILCEKPVSSDPMEIAELEEEAHENNAQVMVAFNRRFDDEIKKVKDQVEQGSIGTPCLLKIANHDGIYPPIETLKNLGPIFSDMHSHDFDSARNILSYEVVSVTAFGTAIHPEMKKIKGDYDTCVLVLRMENDCLVVISGMRQDGGGYQNSMEAIGTDSRVGFGPRLIIDPKSGEERMPKDFGEYFEQSMVDEIREFVECASEGKTVPVSLREARYVAEISAAANKSADIFFRTGKSQEVSIDEVRESF